MKTLKHILVFALLLSSAPFIDVIAESNDDFTIKNTDASKAMNDLVASKKKGKAAVLISDNPIEVLENIAEGDYDLEEVFSSDNSAYTDIIVHDKESDNYILI